MNTHTPGPWVAVARTNAYMEIEAPDQHGYSAKKIASTSLTNHVANAQLISAAPDLLEALQMAKRHLLVGSQPYEYAEAAIAKATGEKP